MQLRLIAAAFLASTATGAYAQQWATDMFEKTEHDFGTVARGSDTVYKFAITNKYKEDIHIAGVSSSCGCTSPSIENDTIKTWEKAYLVAKFNTRTMTGPHSATLTVRFDRPFQGQVQVRVYGNIRGDVVFEPGSVNFGVVDQGASPTLTTRVTHVGRSDWMIQDVTSQTSDLEVELREGSRSGGTVKYDLMVRLKPGVAPGFVKHQLNLVTNDVSAPRIPLDVEGNVVPALRARPDNLQFGAVRPGTPVKKRFLVTGKRPFKITQVACDDPSFRFSSDSGASDRHTVDVYFDPQATDTAGAELKVQRTITVTTDLPGNVPASVTAYASVTPAPVEQESAQPEVEEPAASTASSASSPAVVGLTQKD